MPETEGPVRCELVGDAKANALNLKVFQFLFQDYISSFHRRIGVIIVLLNGSFLLDSTKLHTPHYSYNVRHRMT
jgi:hypothetical protein